MAPAKTQVWRIESGQANLTLETLAKLADVLDLEFDVRPREPAPPDLVRSRTR